MTPDQQSPVWGESADDFARRRAALAAKFGTAWLAEMDRDAGAQRYADGTQGRADRPPAEPAR